MKLEKTITATKLDIVPQMIAESRAKDPEGKKPYKPRAGKPPHRGKGGDYKGKKPYAGKSGGSNDGPAPKRKKPKKPKN